MYRVDPDPVSSARARDRVRVVCIVAAVPGSQGWGSRPAVLFLPMTGLLAKNPYIL